MWRVPFVFLLISPALAAGELAVDTARRGDALEISAHADLTADLPTAWRVLTDYGRYPNFIPDLAVSRVVSRGERSAIVEQKGEARFLFLHRPIEVRLAIAETPLRSVSAHAIGGNVRAFDGRYELVSLPSGVRLNYVGRIVLADAPPGPIDSLVVRLNVARQFAALAREIDRQSSAALRSRGDPGAPTSAPGCGRGKESPTSWPASCASSTSRP